MQKRAALAFLANLCLIASGCGPKAVSGVIEIDHNEVIQAVRSYRLGKPDVAEAAKKPLAAKLVVAKGIPEDDDSYVAKIQADFEQRNFSALETEAADARSTEGRLSGGMWKIRSFYRGLEPTGRTGQPAADAEWDIAMKTLEAWAAAKPGSATARIAQANAHAALAWRARGSGYANTVTQEGWATYHEQMALAANALVEAAKREDRCPYWYLVMQTVALAQQWDRGEVRALFDEAAAFEPDFYYYYQNYANYLEPKWFGEEGETEAFAEQAWLHVGGDQGDIIYFQIAGNRICWCDPDGGRVAQMSWPRIQSGYEATNRLYGASSYTNNRFAFLAFQFHDRAATRAAIRTIENSPDTKVWGPDLFQKAKVWSESEDSTSASSDTY